MVCVFECFCVCLCVCVFVCVCMCLCVSVARVYAGKQRLSGPPKALSGKSPSPSGALAGLLAMESRPWGVVGWAPPPRLGRSRASFRRYPRVQGLTSWPAFSSPSSLSLLSSWERGRAGTSLASRSVQRASPPRPSCLPLLFLVVCALRGVSPPFSSPSSRSFLRALFLGAG